MTNSIVEWENTKAEYGNTMYSRMEKSFHAFFGITTSIAQRIKTHILTFRKIKTDIFFAATEVS